MQIQHMSNLLGNGSRYRYIGPYDFSETRNPVIKIEFTLPYNTQCHRIVKFLMNETKVGQYTSKHDVD